MKNFRFFIKVATIGTAVTVFGIGTAVARKYQVTYELVNKVHNVVSVYAVSYRITYIDKIL